LSLSLWINIFKKWSKRIAEPLSTFDIRFKLTVFLLLLNKALKAFHSTSSRSTIDYSSGSSAGTHPS
jgi:hypothetical protein